jgi:hypothetical protein
MWGTAMDVAQLCGLGLGQYETNFRDNKIDFDVLADLTNGDLQELGVPLGDRRRLLRAIAELGAQQPLTTEAVRKLGERFRMAARSENFLDFSRSARR